MNNVIDLFSRAGQVEPTRRVDPERLREARRGKGYNQRELADKIGVSRQSVSQWEQGAKNPDGSTIARLSEILEQPLSFFAGPRPTPFGQSTVPFYRQFGPKTQKRNDQCNIWKEWLVSTAAFFTTAVKLPEPKLLDWGGNAVPGAIDPQAIEEVAKACRRFWGLGDGPIANLVALMESNGIIMTRVHLGADQVNAFSYWNGDRPFVFLSSETGSAARSRFDAAHELGHLLMHRGVSGDDLEADPELLRRIESEADRFAGAFLLPEGTYPHEVLTSRLEGFKELKKRWKVSIQAQVYRCEDLGIFSELQILNMRKSISKHRWKTVEPLDDELPLEQPVLLAKCLDKAVNEGGADPLDIAAGINLNPSYIAAFCGKKRDFFSQNQAVVDIQLK